jgi:iron complex transport system ATP-binding protein
MNGAATTSIQCHDLTVSVPGRTLIDALSIAVKGGEFLAILGPHGVGKSLALHPLAGIRPAQAALLELTGNRMSEMSRQQIALSLALLPQYTEDIFPATVIDTVMIGRHPHIGRFKLESNDDRTIARQSLAQVDLGDFVNRDVLTLSGGERRRLAVAQILTQSPGVFLLDEPTNHLDPQHQLDVLKIFRHRANDGDAILASLHDVNLASRFADRCLLLFGDGRWELGDSADVLTADRLSELYSTPMETVPWRETNIFVASG